MTERNEWHQHEAEEMVAVETTGTVEAEQAELIYEELQACVTKLES